MYCFYNSKGQEFGQEICTGFFVVNIEHICRLEELFYSDFSLSRPLYVVTVPA